MLHPNLKSTFNNYYTIIISLYSIFKSTRARAKLFHTIRRDTIFLVFFFFFFRNEIKNIFITYYLSMHEISMLRILAYSNVYIALCDICLMIYHVNFLSTVINAKNLYFPKSKLATG